MLGLPAPRERPSMKEREEHDIDSRDRSVRGEARALREIADGGPRDLPRRIGEDDRGRQVDRADVVARRVRDVGEVALRRDRDPDRLRADRDRRARGAGCEVDRRDGSDDRAARDVRRLAGHLLQWRRLRNLGCRRN